MDSTLLLQVIAAISGLVSAGAAAFAVSVAWRGLSTWREQIEGGNRYDTGRRILKSLYAIREGVWLVRSPAITEAELPPNGAPNGSTTASGPRKQLHQIHENRWRAVTGPLADLEVALLDGEVLWGTDFSDQFDPLRQTLHELGLNLHYLAEGAGDRAYQESYGPGGWKRVGDIAISRGTRAEPDEFQRRVGDIIGSLTVMVRERMELRHKR